MILNVALRKRKTLSRMSTSAGWDSTSNGPRIQGDLTRTIKARRLREVEEKDRTLVSTTGEGRKNSLDVHLRTRGEPFRPTLITRTKSKSFNLNAPEMLSTYESIKTSPSSQGDSVGKTQKSWTSCDAALTRDGIVSGRGSVNDFWDMLMIVVLNQTTPDDIRDSLGLELKEDVRFWTSSGHSL